MDDELLDMFKSVVDRFKSWLLSAKDKSPKDEQQAGSSSERDTTVSSPPCSAQLLVMQQFTETGVGVGGACCCAMYLHKPIMLFLVLKNDKEEKLSWLEKLS